LAAGVGFQLTVGWLHLANPTAALAPALIAEGLVLAWVAASAARVDPFAVAPVVASPGVSPVGNGEPVVLEAAPAARSSAVGTDPAGFATRPAKPSIPEAMVGR
jgi:hypothetical protein